MSLYQIEEESFAVRSLVSNLKKVEKCSCNVEVNIRERTHLHT